MNIEWDEEKNRNNIHKHNISLERAKDLFNDPHLFQLAEKPAKWEKNFPEGFTPKLGIDDIVRSKLIGKIDSRLWTAIYTFRGLSKNLTYRIISLRPASKKEIKYYNDFAQM